MIKPTVGRVVWYRPTVHDVKTLGMYAYPDSDQPMAATVAFVHSERMVNLSVVDHKGRQFEKTSVAMLQEGDGQTGGGYAQSDCPHAAPFRYCPSCVADPCPIGLGKAGSAGC